MKTQSVSYQTPRSAKIIIVTICKCIKNTFSKFFFTRTFLSKNYWVRFISLIIIATLLATFKVGHNCSIIQPNTVFPDNPLLSPQFYVSTITFIVMSLVLGFADIGRFRAKERRLELVAALWLVGVLAFAFVVAVSMSMGVFKEYQPSFIAGLISSIYVYPIGALIAKVFP